jgi:hypothetical protein
MLFILGLLDTKKVVCKSCSLPSAMQQAIQDYLKLRFFWSHSEPAVRRMYLSFPLPPSPVKALLHKGTWAGDKPGSNLSSN